ncbi:hypothetical protein Pdw03_7295 [Penicillium digitatum]|uniref:Uncharacterized protein n=1 Tax=Penicillium digitatum TaxID=36651 RepID=A0A7T6XLM8_PENDI|nr:hypothetical protein Pdw03_7295 [Penicillium digitatum]
MSTSEDDVRKMVLAPDDAVTLQNSRLVSPPLSDGTRYTFVSIPDHLISLAALEHLGYNSETATRIWEYWTNWPPGEPKRETDDVYHGMPFMDIVQGYIDNSPDTCEDNDAEWFRCFNLYGIHRELQEVIMDPKFRYIRLTESCKFWVLDTFQLRNRALQTAQDASRERDMARRREASRSRQSSSVGSGQRSISDSLRVVMPWLSRETALSEAAATAASRKPGHTTLYKRIDQARASV